MNKPKYNILDSLWVIHNNKPREIIVYGIHYSKPNLRNNNGDEIEAWNYGFINYNTSTDGVVVPNLFCPSGDLTWYKESKVFSTKEDLIRSLN